jgi:dCMP deaminase
MITKKDRVFMLIAGDLAQLGTCDRKKVGAVITHDGRCVTWGYNGAPPGMPHCEENNHGWAPKFKHNEPEMGCRNATHAEANALAFAARQGISTDGGTLYVTLTPCVDCARLLIAAGIQAVYYLEGYRDPSGRELLEAAGVRCHHTTVS